MAKIGEKNGVKLEKNWRRSFFLEKNRRRAIFFGERVFSKTHFKNRFILPRKINNEGFIK